MRRSIVKLAVSAHLTVEWVGIATCQELRLLVIPTVPRGRGASVFDVSLRRLI